MPHNHRHHIDVNHRGPDFDDQLVVDLDDPCNVDNCTTAHVRVLDEHEYDDLVRRAELHDQLVRRAPRFLVAHYAALAANGYVGTWHNDGRVDWAPPAADDPAGKQPAGDVGGASAPGDG